MPTSAWADDVDIGRTCGAQTDLKLTLCLVNVNLARRTRDRLVGTDGRETT